MLVVDYFAYTLLCPPILYIIYNYITYMFLNQHLYIKFFTDSSSAYTLLTYW